MRIRTGHTPDAWRDLGPSVVDGAWDRPGSKVRGSAVIGDMVVPPSAGNIPLTPGQLRRKTERLERGRAERAARPICGAWMPIKKENCARTQGHAYFHMTRENLEREMVRRHKSSAA